MKIRKTFEIKASIDQLEVGNVISFKLKDGEKVEARAIKREEGKMLMHFVDCLEEEYPMNETDTNEGGYEESSLRRILNSDIVGKFPDKIVKHIVPDENGDLLFLLSIEEMCGCDNEFKKAEGQLTIYKTPKNRVKALGRNGWLEWYWLRSPYGSSAAYFCLVNSLGKANLDNASGAYGLAPAFYLRIS